MGHWLPTLLQLLLGLRRLQRERQRLQRELLPQSNAPTRRKERALARSLRLLLLQQLSATNYY